MPNTQHNKALAGYLKSHKESNGPTSRNIPRQETNRSHESSKSNPSKQSDASRKLATGASRPSPQSQAAQASGGARPKTTPKYRTNKVLENKLSMMRSAKPKMEFMPDEILMHIFSFLPPNSILMLASVCKRWLNLTNDNVLWHKFYQKYGRKLLKKGEKEPKAPSRLPAAYWKNQCIQRGADFRNKKTLPLLKKVSRFSGLPENSKKAIVNSGLTFQLTLVDSRGIEHSYAHSDVFFFRMSTCARWCSLPDCPSLQSVKKLKLFSSNPVFFGPKGEALPNSPCQRSILYATEIKWDEFIKSNSPIGSDETINLFAHPDGIIIATWKDKREIAFVAASFHFHDLVKRCLMGSSTRPYMPPPHQLFPSDIDPKYGLHSCRCSMELRNQRTSLWNEQFMNFDAQPEFQDGHAVFQLIDPERSYQRSWVEKEIIFLWRTDILKGKVKNVSVLDITVLDDQERPMWCGCECVKITAPETDEVDYEYDGDLYKISYRDSFGKVDMLLIWEEQNKKYYITSLVLGMNLQCINSWFGTRY